RDHLCVHAFDYDPPALAMVMRTGHHCHARTAFPSAPAAVRAWLHADKPYGRTPATRPGRDATGARLLARRVVRTARQAARLLDSGRRWRLVPGAERERGPGGAGGDLR